MGRGERSQATTSGHRTLARSVDLPLDIDHYPAELADEVAAAVINVVRAEPIEGQAAIVPKPGVKPLPDSAPEIIGLSGYPRAGKDVAANYLIENYRSVAKINFSDPIIDEVNQFLAPLGHQINEGNKSEPIYRALLQVWGTARRVEDENYWVDRLRDRVQQLSAENRLVLVCGVRALSDAQLVEDVGGQHWRVSRPGNDYQAEHTIERQLDHLDDDSFVLIENDSEGDLAAYYDNIEAALNGDHRSR